MQKVINGLAIASFAVSAAVVGGGVYVYLNKDAMIESAKEGVVKAATEAVSGALPGLIDSAMPNLPSATGDVMNQTNVPPVTGGVIPVK